MRFKIACSVALLLTGLGSSAGLAGPAEQAAIKAGCLTSTNWSEPACQCLSEEAASLTDDQQAYLAAILNGQKGEATQYIMKMTQAQTMQATLFMTKAGPGCH